jgi:isocitrate lyase
MNLKDKWLEEARQLEYEWSNNPRWKGIKRNYSGFDVVRLRGSIRIEYTIAKLGAQNSGIY